MMEKKQQQVLLSVVLAVIVFVDAGGVMSISIAQSGENKVLERPQAYHETLGVVNWQPAEDYRIHEVAQDNGSVSFSGTVSTVLSVSVTTGSDALLQIGYNVGGYNGDPDYIESFFFNVTFNGVTLATRRISIESREDGSVATEFFYEPSEPGLATINLDCRCSGSWGGSGEGFLFVIVYLPDSGTAGEFGNLTLAGIFLVTTLMTVAIFVTITQKKR